MKNSFNETATDGQIQDMIAAFNPFGWLDLKAAVTAAINAGFDADWAAEQVQEFAEQCAMKVEDCDPVYCVYDSIMQAARNEIDQLTNFDIQNNANFEVIGNYMCTSFDYSEADKERLIETLAEHDVNIEDLDTPAQYFLDSVEIDQTDIDAAKKALTEE